MVVAVLAALGSALGFALSTALQHVTAARTPAPARGAGGLGRFVAATVRHPLWLLGLLVDVAAVVLHGLALQQGSLSLVQPVLILGIVFALPVNHRLLGTRWRASELAWSVLLAGALTALLLALDPRAAPLDPGEGTVDQVPAVLLSVATALVVLVLVWTTRGRSGTGPAVLLGVAAGVLFAGTAALLKVVSDELARGLTVPFGHPGLYLLALVGAVGLVVHQLAFQSGPLTASLPAFTVVDPVLSVLLGVAVFDDGVRSDPVSLTVAGAAFAAVTLSSYRLSVARPTDLA